VRGANGEVRKSDRNYGLGSLIEFEEARKGWDFDWRGLAVGEAAVAELACHTIAAGKGIGYDPAEVLRGG